jgi:hypothetical protein
MSAVSASRVALIASILLLAVPAETAIAASGCSQISALSAQIRVAAQKCTREVRTEPTFRNICSSCRQGHDMALKLTKLIKKSPQCFGARYNKTYAAAKKISSSVHQTLKSCGY